MGPIIVILEKAMESLQNFIVVFLFIFTTGRCQDDACQLCLDKVSIGIMHMNGDGIPKTIDILNKQVCPTMPWDLEDCKTGVATYWPKISKEIFNSGVGPYICGPGFIGSCTGRSLPLKTKDAPIWDCPACQNGVSMFGSFYENDDWVDILTNALMGNYFCTNPDNGFPDDAIEECAMNIGMFMPPAFKAIGDAIIMDNNEICNAWYEGICSEI